MKKDQKLAILDRLEEMYPEAKAELVFSNPYEMLVATMLSAQCTDKQVNKVTPAVFARYPDVRTMAEAQAEDLYPMVKGRCRIRGKRWSDCPASGGRRPMSSCQTHSGFRPLRWTPMCSA